MHLLRHQETLRRIADDNGRREILPGSARRVYVIDTTDPLVPKEVSQWTLPVDVQWTRGLEYSLHYLALVNRTLFASVYHGGVWALDLSTAEKRRLAAGGATVVCVARGNNADATAQAIVGRIAERGARST